jgi:hypothetical protein
MILWIKLNGTKISDQKTFRRRQSKYRLATRSKFRSSKVQKFKISPASNS